MPRPYSGLVGPGTPVTGNCALRRRRLRAGRLAQDHEFEAIARIPVGRTGPDVPRRPGRENATDIEP
jgi:hypothetical protein